MGIQYVVKKSLNFLLCGAFLVICLHTYLAKPLKYQCSFTFFLRGNGTWHSINQSTELYIFFFFLVCFPLVLIPSSEHATFH